MHIILTLSEFKKLTEKTLGIKKSLDFYRNLAKGGKLENAFQQGNRWYVRVKTSVYQTDIVEDLIAENIKLKEKLNLIKQFII